MCQQDILPFYCTANFWLTIFGIPTIVVLIIVFIRLNKTSNSTPQTEPPEEFETSKEEIDPIDLQNQDWMNKMGIADLTNRSILGYLGLLGEVKITPIGVNKPHHHIIVSYETKNGEIVSLYLPQSVVHFIKTDQEPKMLITWDEDFLDEEYFFYQDYLEDALAEMDVDDEYINDININRVDIYIINSEHSRLLRTKV